jgi:hypothetical protein
MAGRQIVHKVLAPLEWFYPSAKALHMWRLGRAFRSHTQAPILLLQMGKVGSKSVEAGLEALNLDREIYHAHFLSRERTAETEKQRRKFFRTDRYSYLRRPWLNQFLLKTIKQVNRGPKWKLITLTREPIGRNISAFFENLEVVPCHADGEFEISSDYYGLDRTIVSVDRPQELAALFRRYAKHDSPLKFFDKEIKGIFGIDVFDEGFPKDKGFGIYHGERVDLLVLRLESLASCAREAFSEFLGIDNFEVINRNIGSKKIYAPLYEALKRHASIDSDYADMLYSSEYMRTFYSGEEIAAAREKWLV